MSQFAPKGFTLNSIASDKTNPAAKRNDAIRVSLAAIKVVDGFNARNLDDDEVREHVAGIAGAIAHGLPIPPIEVWVDPSSGDIELVDGHCRYEGYKLYAAEAKDFDGYVPAMKFEGTAAQRKARIVTSNNQLKLKPVELGRVYLSLRDEHGMARQEIASEVGKSLAHVDQMILLASAKPEVIQAVEDGSISATEAVKLTRDHGEDAPAELERRQEAAKEIGKGKVTAKVAPVVKTPKLDKSSKAKYQQFVIYAAEAWANSLSEERRADIELGDVSDQETALLADLLHCLSELRDCDKALDADNQMDLLGSK